MSEYWSHPNYLLKKHIKDVTNDIRLLIESKNINYKELETSKEEIKAVLTLMGACHDFGKYSDYFQHYIHSSNNSTWDISDKNEAKLRRNKRLKDHSLISAVMLFSILRELFKDEYEEKKNLVYIAVSSVVSHHGNLNNKNYWNNYKKEDVERLKDIYNTINLNEFKSLLKHYFPNKSVSFLDKSVNETFDDFFNLYEEGFFAIFDTNKNLLEDTFIKNNFRENDIYLMQFVFSTLIYSDKYSAIFKEDIVNKGKFNKPNAVDDYKVAKGFTYNSELNKQRQECYELVSEMAYNVPLSVRLFNLTMNTGYGKTLASFNFSLKLKERLLKEQNIDYKIIYAMPFTSIIEQNFEVLRELINHSLGKDFKDKLSSDILLKHHYLAPTEYSTNEESFDSDKSKFLIETWDGEVTFTTFVQLFELFFTNENKRLLKFPNIINSIIVIDEIQALPEDLYLGIQLLFEKISKIFNIYVVYTSATQPYFTHSTLPLLSNYKDYYQTERTKIILHDEIHNNKYLADTSLSKAETYNFVESIIEKEVNKNILIILNTKKSAHEMAVFCKELYTDKDVILLSNSLTGKHKQEKIDYIQNNLSKKNMILVSTQLIEAGVDIDFDVAIRDFATVPSILQAVGRVNRSFNHSNFYGKLYLINFDNLSKWVYQEKDSLLDITFDSLKKMKSKDILETDYLKLNKIYIKKMERYFTTKKGLDLLENLEKLNYKKAKLKLIEDNTDNITLFIEYDEEATQLWKNYTDMLYRYQYDKLKLRKAFLEIKSSFLSYTVKLGRKQYRKIMSPYKSQNEITEDLDKNFILIDSVYCGEFGDYLYSKEHGIKLDLEKNNDPLFL